MLVLALSGLIGCGAEKNKKGKRKKVPMAIAGIEQYRYVGLLRFYPFYDMI